MADHPYISIDQDYYADIEAAIEAHEQGVAAANAKLSVDLAATDDSVERAEILVAFDITIAPVREAFEVAREAAESKRETNRTKAAAAVKAYEDDLQAVKDSESAEALALAAKLKAGTATSAELQKALGDLVESKAVAASLESATIEIAVP